MNDIAQARFDQQYAKHVSALKLQGHARKTIESYSYALRRLGAYFDRCPDDLTLDDGHANGTRAASSPNCFPTSTAPRTLTERQSRWFRSIGK